MKVSIITTAYNSEHTISETIESVLRQKYRDIEYWIIDGLSTDKTMDIVRSYEHAFNGRMHYLSEKDHGLYDAMNKGIALCAGDIIGFLNSDDYFTSDDVVGHIAKEFDNNDIDAVYGDIHFINGNEPDKTVRYYSSAHFRPFLLRFGFMPAHPSFYVKRHIYEKYGTYSLDYKIASDYDIMVRLFCKHHIKATYIQKDFVTMRTGGISTKSIRNRLLITKEDVKACRRYGFYTNVLFVSVKYIYKIFEFKRFQYRKLTKTH